MNMNKNTTSPSGLQTPDPDLEDLREFATETERMDPPSFVGRRKIIETFKADVLTRTRKWYYRPKGKPREGEKKNAWKGAWKSATWLFQGAPGAGKTALISQLEPLTVPKKTWLTRTGLALALGKNTERPVQVCQINNLNILEDMWELQKKIAGTWIPGAEKEMEARRMLEMGVSLEVAHGKEQTEKTLMSWEDVVKKVTGNPGEYPPMLMMMDEAQAIDHKAGKQLLWLHQGNDGLPIVPVFGGLAYTRKRFKDKRINLSRIGNDRALTLKGLPEKDCREAVRRFLKKFRIIASAQATEQWTKAIAEDCMGWPQHLHVGLQGMAWELLEPGVDGNLDQADLKKARQFAKERRNAYYSDRLDSDSLKGKRYLTAAAAERLTENPKMTEDELGVEIEKIHSLGVSGKFVRSCLPKGLSGEEFAEGMTHAGILQEDGDGFLIVPIPCFQSYLLEKLEQWGQDRKAPSEPEEDSTPDMSPGF